MAGLEDDQREPAPSVRLRSLAPRYDPTQHALYVDALQRAIDGNARFEPGIAEVRNIALTGPYGVGKSSVLMEVADRFPGRVIELSLSSVGRGPAAGEPEPEPVLARVQKEIVKQILYRDAPARTRGSRFRRLSRLPVRRIAGVAAAGATVLLALCYLVGWGRALVGAAAPTGEPVPVLVAYVALWLLLAVGLVAAQWVAYGQLSLEKLSAGPATVTLSGERGSYFDQFVDEIVYYFEQTRRDVVIFEDLDRFDDVRIFESLRALNTLLNSAEQVRGRPRRSAGAAEGQGKGAARPRRAPVVFVYALRDSVFERIEESGASAGEDEEARQERQRSNRTKFFDLIVPVVPFISRRNARDLMRELMDGSGVGDGVIRLAAQHVPDQRLLIDLRNEFDVYADRLLFGERVLPGLTRDKVFAMLLFKAVHLADFERIRFGSSRLDRLWEQWRALVSAGLDRADAQERAAMDALGVESAGLEHARVLADRVDELARSVLGVSSRERYIVQAGGGAREAPDRLRDPEFWRLLVDQRATLTIASGWSPQETWQFETLAVRLERPLEVEQWRPVDELRQHRRQEAAVRDREFLTHHSWQQLLQRPEFMLPPGTAEEPARSFAELVDALGSPLTRDLIASGFIDEFFGLYVSLFYGRLISFAALDFMVRALDRGRQDPDHRLEPADVTAILVERGAEVLRDRAAYNVSLLDHLLAGDDPAAAVMVGQLAVWSPEDAAFTTRYLQRGTRPEVLVGRLAPLRSDLVGFLLEVAVTAKRRVELVDAALAALGTDVEVADDRLGAFVVEHYRHFPSMTRPDVEGWTTTAAAAVGGLGVRLPDLTGLNTVSVQSLAASGGYAFTVGNLAAVSGGSELALDLLTRAPMVRATVLGRLSEYLEMLRSTDGQVSVAGPAAFARVLGEVAERSPDTGVLVGVALQAAPECRIERLGEAPSAVWPSLLNSQRTSPTARNLLTYLEQFLRLEEVESCLGGLRRVEAEADLAGDDRRLLAAAILDTALPVAHRVALVAGLQPGLLTAVEVPQQPGPLVGLLLASGLLEDGAETFVQLVRGWASRETAIAAASGFGSYVDAEVLPAADLGLFFASALVPERVKEIVLEGLEGWDGDLDEVTAGSVAAWAVTTGQTPPPVAVELLIEAGAPVRALVVLLSRVRLPVARLQQLLRRLGGVYAAVAGRGTRPVRLPNDAAHRAIVQQLRDAREVGQVKPEGDELRVWLRRSSS